MIHVEMFQSNLGFKKLNVFMAPWKHEDMSQTWQLSGFFAVR